MNNLVPIIMGSDSDIEFGLKIKNSLKNNFEIDSIIRVCSAHKDCLRLLKILNEYENNNNVKSYITIAGKSNALSALVDANSTKPVISCPPIKDNSMYDIYSSISMPSGISPLTILGTENASVSAAKIISLTDEKTKNLISEYKLNMQHRLNINDIKCKYELNNNNLLNENSFKNCVGTEIKSDYAKLVRTGKVRDIYTYENQNNENTYILVASDRISAFDRHLTTIPYKGSVLHKVSNWWFNKTKDFVPNHIIDSQNNRTMTVQKCKVFPIEFVMRAYLTGSTDTSIWKNYDKGLRFYCGHNLPDGMVRNQKLPNILLTPTTKDEHDELISENEIIEREIMTKEQWNICKKYSYLLFEYGQKIAKEKGLILVDTKYEFGTNEKGEILLVDELHTPDSSRYWMLHSYKNNFSESKEPESIDKEIVRRYVKENCGDPYNPDNKIIIPDKVRLQLSSKYLQLHEIITGSEIDY